MKTEKPNIIIIMSDEQRVDFSKAEGFPLDVTPAIDRLGKQGIRFSKAYTSAPVCVPARCSMFTGRFMKAHTVRDNFSMESISYSRDLLDVLKGCGYQTALIGKNHSYIKDRWDYQRSYSHWNGPEKDSKFADWLRDLPDSMSLEPTPFPLEEQFSVRIVDDAISYIKEDADKPFFMWLSFPDPHYPYQVSEPYFSMFSADEVPSPIAGPEELAKKNYHWQYQYELVRKYSKHPEDIIKQLRAIYCGQLRLMDDQISRFLDYLEQQKMLDNTLIVFISDHGDFIGDFGLQRKGVGLSESLVRIPMIWKGPKLQQKGCVSEPFVSMVDIFPTICEYLGQEIPEGVQGRSILPILQGENNFYQEFESIFAEAGFFNPAWSEQDEFGNDSFMSYYPEPFPPIFNELNDVTQSGNRKMLRKDHWKLIVDEEFGDELFNLNEDPHELNNLADCPNHCDIKNELIHELLLWSMRTDNDLPISKRYIRNQRKHNWRKTENE